MSIQSSTPLPSGLRLVLEMLRKCLGEKLRVMASALEKSPRQSEKGVGDTLNTNTLVY